jgi:hypothetical protein
MPLIPESETHRLVRCSRRRNDGFLIEVNHTGGPVEQSLQLTEPETFSLVECLAAMQYQRGIVTMMRDPNTFKTATQPETFTFEDWFSWWDTTHDDEIKRVCKAAWNAARTGGAS